MDARGSRAAALEIEDDGLALGHVPAHRRGPPLVIPVWEPNVGADGVRHGQSLSALVEALRMSLPRVVLGPAEAERLVVSPPDSREHALLSRCHVPALRVVEE